MGDIDGDGKLDVVIVNQTTNTVSIFRNTSGRDFFTASTLASNVDLPVGANPNALALQDLDGDGKPELIVLNNRDNSVSVYHNNSVPGIINASSFGPKAEFATGTYPLSMAIGDIDGDGKPDIVVANGTLTSILLNKSSHGIIGSSSFAPKYDLAAKLTFIVLADFDGDEKLDLAGTGTNLDGEDVVSRYKNRN